MAKVPVHELGKSPINWHLQLPINVFIHIILRIEGLIPRVTNLSISLEVIDSDTILMCHL